MRISTQSEFRVLGLILLVAAVVHVFLPDVFPGLNERALVLVGTGAALLVLPEIRSLSVGGYKVEFERLRRDVHEALDMAGDAQARGPGTGKAEARLLAPATEAYQPGAVPNDPWKGVFGGRAETAGRRLTAKVKEDGALYRVILTVESTNPQWRPLSGSVQFFLHSTFTNDRPVVPVGASHRARLTLYAYGALTVGAVVDGGATRLELDLADLEDAPANFRAN